MFGVSGENLTARMRKDAFEAMLKQEMGWFDKVENNTGSLYRGQGGVNHARGCRSSHCGHHGALLQLETWACMFFVLPSPEYSGSGFSKKK